MRECHRFWTMLQLALCWAAALILLSQLLLVSEGERPEASEAPTSGPRLLLETQRMFDLSDFRFLLDAPCAPAPLVVMVHSAPANDDFRDAIRASWGSQGVRVVFMVGEAAEEGVQRGLEEEARRHGDLVQGNFRDSYHNLTYKHVMALDWFRRRCQGVRFALKADDDTFVGLDHLLTLIDQNTFPDSNIIVCDVTKRAEVKRSWRSKWRVSPREISSRHYPPYCPGWMVLYSGDVVAKLSEGVRHESFFWIDDVLITGVVAQKLGVRHHPFEKWKLNPHTAEEMLLNKTPAAEFRKFVFGPYELEPKGISALWHLVQTNSSDLKTNNSSFRAKRL